MSGSQCHDQVSLLLLAMQKNSCNSVIAYGSFEQIVIYFSATTVMSSWNQWGVMAAGYCCSWWRWSDTFWVTLTRLWLHLFLLHFFWFGQNWFDSYLQSVIMEFFVPFYRSMTVHIANWTMVQNCILSHYVWYLMLWYIGFSACTDCRMQDYNYCNPPKKGWLSMPSE